MEDVSLFDYDIYLRRASRCEMNHCHILLESKLKWPFKLNSKRVKGLFMHEFIHYVQQDELGDTYDNIVQCICASGSLVRYRPTTVAFVLTRAFFSAFLNYNIDNVYLGDMRLKHIDLKVDSLLSNGEVAAKCLSE